jgi:hypothetical protein
MLGPPSKLRTDAAFDTAVTGVRGRPWAEGVGGVLASTGGGVGRIRRRDSTTSSSSLSESGGPLSRLPLK